MEKVEIIVENLKCHGCAHTISSKLEKMEGVENVKVDVENSIIEFEHNADKLGLDRIKKKLAAFGYPEKGNNSFKANVKSYYSCMIGRIRND